ncbi:MAG TPA: protein kinase [Gemmatimonadaceae bacterium]|nr:protein kinase [Gemmatimonadaceae bacterium]
MSDAARPMIPPRDTSPDMRWPRELDAEYECVGELGRGGMAIVYHARDKELQRDVAVKVVRTRYAQDQEAVARLAREARTVAHLEHPNLVALHAVKRLSDDSLALVMQLVPGKTLKQTLRDEGPFAPERVERVLRDIARALAYAHARGIVHRDVKPENIFLDAGSGRALLSDFGVAIREADTSLTATGTAIGTPTYMSPEQIDGARVDGRSDLYSLGLVAWEMLTGRRPWDGESLYSVIYRQKHEELVPIEEVRPDVPERLRYLVDGLLRKQPASRWANAERFLTRLNDASDPPGLKQWRQFKKKQAKNRKEAARAAPNEDLLPEAATERFRRSLATERFRRTPEDRAAVGARADLVNTPQVIRVETSATPMDEWKVEDDGTAVSSQRADRATKWGVGIGIAASAIIAGILLIDMRPPAVVKVDSTRSTFTDAGSIEVPAVRPDSAPGTVVTDTAPAPVVVIPPPARETPKETVSTPRQTPPIVAPQPVITTPPPARDTAPTPNVTPSVPSLSFPAERARVTAGSRHSCVISSVGKANCWGNNAAGQLGDGSMDVQVTPVSVAGDFVFSQLSAGDSHTCGVTTAGEALCWGDNDAGQLGDGTTSARTAPVRVSGGHNFSYVRAGRSHTCGLTTSGAVVCWGNNGNGQLGDGSRVSRNSPVRVPLPGAASRLGVGGSHTCALLNDGSAYCWGANTYSQLGDSSKTSRTEPVRVATSQRFVSIGSGREHTCAVTLGNDAYCWGRNSSGQAGIGTSSEAVAAPQRVETNAQFLTIAAGLSHTCARTVGGMAYCWGRNNYGQLGDGTLNNHSRPVAVQGAGALVALFPGASHTCGVNSSNETFCWGYNVDGQLGIGGRENSPVPVKVQDSSR